MWTGYHQENKGSIYTSVYALSKSTILRRIGLDTNQESGERNRMQYHQLNSEETMSNLITSLSNYLLPGLTSIRIDKDNKQAY